MDSDSLQARLQHGIAELRGTYPHITKLHAALEDWYEEAAARHSLWLDIRWPQHQSIIGGPPCNSADQALRAGFEAAAKHLVGRLVPC